MSETPDQAKVRLVNRALVKAGVSPTYSIDGESRTGALADMAWQSVEGLVFSPPFNWSFARDTLPCIPLAETPQNGWPYGFALPGGRIGPPLAILEAAGQNERKCRDFMAERGNIYAMVPALWARVRIAVSPDTFDAGFANAFVTALAAELVVPLREDTDRAAELARTAFGDPRLGGAGGLFGALLTADRASSQQTGRGFLDQDPLTAARI